jgi:hypothetical protein
MSDTKTIWKERVAGWRASGETAEAFCAAHGWSPNTLRWWSSRLSRDSAPPIVRVAQVVRAVEPSGGGRGAIVVEQLDARVRITIEPGADRDALAIVLDRLTARTAQ